MQLRYVSAVLTIVHACHLIVLPPGLFAIPKGRVRPGGRIWTSGSDSMYQYVEAACPHLHMFCVEALRSKQVRYVASGDYGLVFRVLRMVDSSKARVRHMHTNRSEAPCRCFKRPPRMRKIPTWCWTFHEGPTARQSGKPTEGPSRLPGFQPVGDSLEMHRKAGEAMASRQSERRRTRPGSKRERACPGAQPSLRWTVVRGSPGVQKNPSSLREPRRRPGAKPFAQLKRGGCPVCVTHTDCTQAQT